MGVGMAQGIGGFGENPGISLLLVEEILHQLIGSLFHNLQDFIFNPGSYRISSINSSFRSS